MSRVEKIVENFENSDISMIVSNPGGGNAEVLTNTLYELGIKRSKDALFFNFDGPNLYYEILLLSRLSLLPHSSCEALMCPCKYSSKEVNIKERAKVFQALLEVQKSKIIMVEMAHPLPMDPVDYILEYTDESNKVLIIQYFQCLVEISKYSLEEILQKLIDFAQNKKHKILLSFISSDKLKTTHLNPTDLNMALVKRYVNNIMILALAGKQDDFKRIWCYSPTFNFMFMLSSNKNTLEFYEKDSNYVFLDMEVSGFDYKKDQILKIMAVKTNQNFKVIDRLEVFVKPKKKISKKILDFVGITKEDLENGESLQTAILDLMVFVQDSEVIGYNLKFMLSFLMKGLYDEKLNQNFRFWYIDLIDILKKEEKPITFEEIKKYYKIKSRYFIDSLMEIVKCYLKSKEMDDLKEFCKVCNRSIFRGLDYPAYNASLKKDKKFYFFQIYDFSKDNYVAYYVHTKEIRGEDFSIEELQNLKEYGAKVTISIHYFDDVSKTFADAYFVMADRGMKSLENDSAIILGVRNYLNCEDKPNIILFGEKENIKEIYRVLKPEEIEKLMRFVKLETSMWGRLSLEQFEFLEKE